MTCCLRVIYMQWIEKVWRAIMEWIMSGTSNEVVET